MPYTIVMKLEQILPMLRDGKTITRQKPQKNGRALVLFVKINNDKLQFRFITSYGDEIDWSYYTLKTDDVMAENWEVAE